MKQKLTERTVARLKPPSSGKLDVWDLKLPAFGIQLRSTGRRAWIIAVRRPGKSTTSRIKIGDPATMSLAEAQERARELCAIRAPSKPMMTTGGSTELTADSPMADVIEQLHRARPEAAQPQLACGPETPALRPVSVGRPPAQLDNPQ